MHIKKSEDNILPNFWRWFFIGDFGSAGYTRFIDAWLILHALIGFSFSYILPKSLEEIATTILLPVVGILIGLSFAWGGNAQALLQTTEIEEISKYKKGGISEYVHTFQAAILLILITLVFWTIAGMGIFDNVWPKEKCIISYKAISFLLFFFSSMTLRECWHVVLGAHHLLLIRFKVRNKEE